MKKNHLILIESPYDVSPEELKRLQGTGHTILSIRRSAIRTIKSIETEVPFEENYKIREFQKRLFSLKEFRLFSREGNNWWYLFEYALFNAGIKIPASLSIFEALYLIDVTVHLTKRYPASEITVHGETVWMRAIRHLLGQGPGFEPEAALWRRAKRKALIARIYLRKAISLARRERMKSDRTDCIAISSDRFRARPHDHQIWGGILSALEVKGVDSTLLEYDRMHYRPRQVWGILKSYMGRDESTYVGSYYNGRWRKRHAGYCRLFDTIGRDARAFFEGYSYNGHHLWPLISNRAEHVFDILIPHFAELLSTAEEVLEQERPSVILVDHEESGYAKAFLYAAKGTKTKVVAAQYEMVYPNCLHAHVKNRKTTKESRLSRPVPHLKLASGQYCKETLVRYCDYEPSMIRVVGAPRFDQEIAFAQEMTEEKKERLRRKLGVPTDKRIITYATGQAHSERATLPPLIQELKKRDDWFLILKIHPSARKEEFIERYDLPVERIAIMQHADVREILGASDILVAISSTMALEAMLFGLPVLLLEVLLHCPIPYAAYGAATSVTYEDEIGPSLRGLIDERRGDPLRKGRESFLAEYLFKIDGKSSERAAELVHRMVTADRKRVSARRDRRISSGHTRARG